MKRFMCIMAVLASAVLGTTETARATSVGDSVTIAAGSTSAVSGQTFATTDYGEANWLKAFMFTVAGSSSVTGVVTLAMYDGGVRHVVYTSTNYFNGAAVRVNFGTNDYYTGRLRVELQQATDAAATTFTWKALVR